jgi:YVTN family beta-propeller protein
VVNPTHAGINSSFRSRSSAASRLVYVTYTRIQDGRGYVGVISPKENKILATVPVGRNPGPVALSPDGTTVYVANRDDATLSVIDTSTNRVSALLPTGTNPTAILITPDNKRTYVAGYDGKAITVIDNASFTVITTISLQGHPFSLTVDPNGRFVLAACKGSSSGLDSYAIIHTEDHSVHMESGCWTSADHNPIAVSANGLWFAVSGVSRIVMWSIQKNSCRYHSSWTLGPHWGVVSTDNGRWHGNFYFIRNGPSPGILHAEISSGFTGPHFIESYKGQRIIAGSPDQRKICITIAGEHDQRPGLHIIEPQEEQTSHFVELQSAYDVGITEDSSKAFVTGDNSLTPVDLASYMREEPIAVEGRIRGIAACYRTQS